MSPEQVRAQEVDCRSDLFSFGVALYEMATGTRPFQGATTSLLLDSILSSDPVTPSRLNPSVAPDLDRIILKCLAKSRDLRYQRASDVRAELQRLVPDLPDRAGSKAARPAALLWMAAVLVLALIAIAAYTFFRPAPALTDKDTIVLADFENTTGDEVFDGVLRQGLAVQLRQSPFLSLVSDERIRQQLQLMGQPAGATLTPQLAKDLCERNGSTAVVDGSIAALGSQFVLGLRARACATGDVIHDEQAQSPTREGVLDVLSRMAVNLRTRAGESLASVERHATPLAEATTSSIAALKAFTTAENVAMTAGYPQALPLFVRAVEIDPGFAIAHASLGAAYSNLGESVLAIKSTARAYELRDRASERERFNIMTLYDRQVTGNLERQRQTLATWVQTYPRDPYPPALMAGFASIGTGQFESAIEYADTALALDPNLTPAYATRALHNLYLGRLADAEASVQRALERKLEFPDFFLVPYFVSFLRDDNGGMKRAVAQAAGKPGVEDWIAWAEALVLARSGRLHDARRLSRVAVNLAEQSGQRERAAMFEAGVAVWEAFFGYGREASERASKALVSSTGRDVQFAGAFALALSGESSRAQTLADDLEKRFPEDTCVRFSYLPPIRALLSLNAREPTTALQQLQASERMDFAVPGVSFNGFFGALYSVYVRGLAYLAAQQPEAATTEFQKILNHRGIVLGDPMDAVARLQLARALAQSGDSVKARAAYQELLSLWRAADQDLLLLKQARTEPAKLP
jgi:tetratricopeptide (TPR) repeat protein